MKIVWIAALVVCLFPGMAKADTILDVTIAPTYFSTPAAPGGQATVGLSFTWDTTTQTLSGFDITGLTGYSTTPSTVLFDGSGGLRLIDLNGPNNGELQLDQSDYFLASLQPVIGNGQSVGFDLGCFDLTTHKETCSFGTEETTASITDPLATPEPAAVNLLMIGLVGLTGFALLAGGFRRVSGLLPARK